MTIKMLIFIALLIGISISGCIDNPLDKSPQTPAQISNPDDHNKINELIIKLNESGNEINNLENKMAKLETKIDELENKKNSMQKELEEMRTKLNNKVDLLKPSDRDLIPRTPFIIEIWFGEANPPTSWTFRESGAVELGEGDAKEYGTYKILANNSIKIKSKKYDFYGIILYDDYVVAIYENGWIAWVHKYNMIAPTLNPETQKYEIS